MCGPPSLLRAPEPCPARCRLWRSATAAGHSESPAAPPRAAQRSQHEVNMGSGAASGRPSSLCFMRSMSSNPSSMMVRSAAVSVSARAWSAWHGDGEPVFGGKRPYNFPVLPSPPPMMVRSAAVSVSAGGRPKKEFNFGRETASTVKQPSSMMVRLAAVSVSAHGAHGAVVLAGSALFWRETATTGPFALGGGQVKISRGASKRVCGV